MAGVWAKGASKKFGTPYVFLQLLKLAISNLVHKFGLGLAYQKRRLGPKLAGSWLAVHPKKIGTSYLLLQPLKLATSNLVHNLRLGLAYQNQRFGPKLEGGFARGAFKTLGPLRISATVEASNFKFGTQIGFGTSLPENGV